VGERIQPTLRTAVQDVIDAISGMRGGEDEKAVIAAGVIQAQALDRLTDMVRVTNKLLTQLLEVV
jgi:hypothetical protein